MSYYLQLQDKILKKVPKEAVYIFLLSFCLFLIMVLIRWISGFNGLYGQDSHEYLRYSRKLAAFLTGGENPGDYFWPVNFPLYGALLSLVIRNNICALQLISMVSSILTLVYVWKMICFLFPKMQKDVTRFYIVLTLFFSPFIFQSAFLIMSDMLAVFFSISAMYHIFKYRKDLLTSDFLFAVFLSASAVMTRYPTALLLLIPLAFAVYTFFKNFRSAIFLAALIIIVVCFAPHALIRSQHIAEFLGHNFLKSWSMFNWFKTEFTTVQGYTDYFLPNLIYGFSHFFYPGFLFLGILLIPFVRKPDLSAIPTKILILVIILYALFLAGIPFQSMRYLISTFPFVIILLYPAFERMLNLFFQTSGKRYLFTILVIFMQSGLIYKYSSTIVKSNRLEKQIAAALISFDEQPIYTFWIDGALKSYGVDNQIINLWETRLTEADTAGMVLFNIEKFEHQWEGQNPVINWEFLKGNYQLDPLAGFSDGWVLYKIHVKQSE